jgi:hypothetical protein
VGNAGPVWPPRAPRRPRVATVHLALGQLLRRVNRRGEAREHLTVAATMFREMDLRARLAATEAAFRELE